MLTAASFRERILWSRQDAVFSGFILSGRRGNAANKTLSWLRSRFVSAFAAFQGDPQSESPQNPDWTTGAVEGMPRVGFLSC
jgi:hypothetical protein